VVEMEKRRQHKGGRMRRGRGGLVLLLVLVGCGFGGIV